MFDDASRYQIFPKQPGIHKHPDRHERVNRALELHEQIEIAIGILPPNPPDYVIVPLPQFLGHMVCGNQLKGGEVNIPHKVLWHEVLEKARHHVLIGEEGLVSCVVRYLAAGHRQFFSM